MHIFPLFFLPLNKRTGELVYVNETGAYIIKTVLLVFGKKEVAPCQTFKLTYLSS